MKTVEGSVLGTEINLGWTSNIAVQMFSQSQVSVHAPSAPLSREE